ncbi:MAG TPA: septum formation initiator family protein [Terriglobia bacterium]|nr:septum formation initiator family protein [Terriglobia bacterium]
MNLLNWDRKTLRRNALFAMALLSLVLLMHEIFGSNGYMTLRREKKDYTALQRQIQKVSIENQQLEQKIHALKNNPEAIEKQARDQLRLARPGEIIYTLPDKGLAESSAGPRQGPPAQTPTRR